MSPPRNDQSVDEARLGRARRNGRRAASALIVVVSVLFILASAVQIVSQVFFGSAAAPRPAPAGSSTSSRDEVGLRPLHPPP